MDQQERTEDWINVFHGQYPAAVEANTGPQDTWEWLLGCIAQISNGN